MEVVSIFCKHIQARFDSKDLVRMLQLIFFRFVQWSIIPISVEAVRVGITLAKATTASAKLGLAIGGATIEDELTVEVYALTCSLIFSSLFLSLSCGRGLILGFPL